MESSYPFDTGPGANVLEGEWQKMARAWLASGVIAGTADSADLLAVTANGAAMQVTVATGVAWVEGFLYHSDAARALAIGVADATNPRVDTVVVRLDRAANTATAVVKPGVAGAAPAAPALTQTDVLWELPLADVRVDAAAGVIVAGKVTDRREFTGPASGGADLFVKKAGGDTITASAPAVKPLTVKGAAGQTGNLFEAQDSTGTVLARVNSVGTVFAPTAFVGPSAGLPNVGTVRVAAEAAAERGLVLKGAASQTANLMEFQNSAGTVLARVSNVGQIDGSRVVVNNADPTNQGLVVKGAASQTANLMEFQNSAGTVLAAFEATGRQYIDGTLITASATPGTATLPAGPQGFISVNIAGTHRKIPYYPAA